MNKDGLKHEKTICVHAPWTQNIRRMSQCPMFFLFLLYIKKLCNISMQLNTYSKKIRDMLDIWTYKEKVMSNVLGHTIIFEGKEKVRDDVRDGCRKERKNMNGGWNDEEKKERKKVRSKVFGKPR